MRNWVQECWLRLYLSCPGAHAAACNREGVQAWEARRIAVLSLMHVPANHLPAGVGVEDARRAGFPVPLAVLGGLWCGASRPSGCAVTVHPQPGQA